MSLIVLFFISWSGAWIGHEYILFLSYGLTLSGVLACILSLLWFRKHIKRIAIATLIFGVLFVAIFPINSAYNTYQKSLIMAEPEVDVSTYVPFSGNSELAQLGEPSSLKLESDLPKLDGATALYPVYSAFAEAVYPKKQYSASEYEVRCTNTLGAYESLINGDVDIIFVAKPSEGQKELAASKGVDLHMTPIGNEAFVFFVNTKNKVGNLRFEQLKGIYTGEITNWKTVGGSNSKIIAYQRNEGSGSQTMFLSVMKGTDIQKAPQEQEIGDMGGIIEKTARYKNAKNALGFSFLYYATRMKGADGIKILSINGVEPNKETIRSRKYPFTGAFYAITNGKPIGNAKLLIDWILSAQGQDLIEKTGYVGI